MDLFYSTCVEEHSFSGGGLSRIDMRLWEVWSVDWTVSDQEAPPTAIPMFRTFEILLDSSVDMFSIMVSCASASGSCASSNLLFRQTESILVVKLLHCGRSSSSSTSSLLLPPLT